MRCMMMNMSISNANEQKEERKSVEMNGWIMRFGSVFRFTVCEGGGGGGCMFDDSSLQLMRVCG